MRTQHPTVTPEEPRLTRRGSPLPSDGRPVLDDAYLPLKRLAAYAGLSVRTLQGYLKHAVSPLPFYRIGGRVLVRRSEFDAWAQQFRKTQDGCDVTAIVDDVVGACLR